MKNLIVSTSASYLVIYPPHTKNANESFVLNSCNFTGCLVMLSGQAMVAPQTATNEQRDIDIDKNFDN